MSHFGKSGPPDIIDTYSLLVLNISFRTTADDLFPFFDKYGKVVDIFIPRDRKFFFFIQIPLRLLFHLSVFERLCGRKMTCQFGLSASQILGLFSVQICVRTGESRGFAFVRYKYQDEAQKAVDRLDGRLIHGREIMVQFAKYGPNAERIDKGRVIEPVPRTSIGLRSRSPQRRYRDDIHRDYDYPRRRSRSRSLDRYDRDRYHGRERDYRHQSRTRGASPDYDRGRGKGRYYDDQSRSRSRSFESASPRRDSLSPRRSLSPRKKPSSRGESPDRRSYDERSPTPRSVSPRRRPADSQSPSPRNSDLDE